MSVVENPLISVIVPVYNVEKYLTRCIDSILAQRYPYIEILLIDDGSTDGSSSICEQYAQKYNNISVYHQKNGGLAAARNTGLLKCQGEYIGFIDSDDFIAADMYEYLYNLLIKNQAECASIDFVFTTLDVVTDVQLEEKVSVYEGEEILEKHLMEATTTTGAHSVCRCLFARSILSNMYFRVGIINEDIAFKFMALARCKRMVCSNQPKYFYYQKGESITRGAFTERALDLFKATSMLVDAASTHNQTIRNLAKAKHERGYFSILARIAFYGSAESKEWTEEIIGICQRQLRDNWRFLCSMPLPLSRKMLILLFACNFQLAELCIRLAKIILGQRK